MSDQFLHGVEVITLTEGARPIRTLRSSVIGLVGTAPKGALNEPVLIVGSPTQAAELFGTPDLAGYSSGFTIPQALKRIFDFGGATVVVVNVCDPATHKTAVAGADRTITNKQIQLPHRFVREVVVKEAGGAGAALVVGTDYTLDADKGLITVITGGALTNDAAAHVAYAWVDPSKVLEAAVIGSSTTRTGVYALLNAQALHDVTPRILIATGHTHQRAGGNANGVVAALSTPANSLRAHIVADGPNTNNADALAYRNDWGSRRIFIVDPWEKTIDGVTGAQIAMPASAAVAGLIAQVDVEEGFWVSPSNHILTGTTGMGRPIDFSLGDPNTTANYLNENEIATIIREQGYRLWGNRTTSADPAFAFLAHSRTADMIMDSVQRAHLWAVDRNITRNFIEAVVESVNDYLRRLIALGAIVGGKCWPNPDLNTPQSLADGRLYLDFDFTPSPVAERITFRAIVTPDYLSELIDEAA
jgi:phage tail sheath protein FI